MQTKFQFLLPTNTATYESKGSKSVLVNIAEHKKMETISADGKELIPCYCE
jgi:hypothetical protein